MTTERSEDAPITPPLGFSERQQQLSEVRSLQTKFNLACERYDVFFSAADYDRWYWLHVQLTGHAPQSPKYTGLVKLERVPPG